jgi:hypothetical protein
VWQLLESMAVPTPERPDPANAIILTNSSYHWDGNRPATGLEHGYLVGKFAGHPLPGDLMARVLAAVKSYGSIPEEV